MEQVIQFGVYQSALIAINITVTAAGVQIHYIKCNGDTGSTKFDDLEKLNTWVSQHINSHITKKF